MAYNILLFDLVGSYMQADLLYALKKMGHSVNSVSYRINDKYEDDEFYFHAQQHIKNGRYDLVFTTNFYPILSKVCYDNNVPYISWIYDSPPDLPTDIHMNYEKNLLFFFSRADAVYYREGGIENVYHMPLAVNTKRLDSISADRRRYGAQISFVGNMYEPVLPTLMTGMNSYQQGYIEAVAQAQRVIYGADLMDALITDDIATDVCRTYISNGIEGLKPGRRELKWAVAEYITCLDRLELLNSLAFKYDTHLYTFELSDSMKNNMPDVKIHPSVDYLHTMPIVFKSSDINLCPILRANPSGIPLRALDIMGCKAFMLVSWQPELAEYFTSGEDIVMYSDMDEAKELTVYYMEHPEERTQVAEMGYTKVKELFSYEKQLGKILDVFEEHFA